MHARVRTHARTHTQMHTHMCAHRRRFVKTETEIKATLEVKGHPSHQKLAEGVDTDFPF